MITQKELQEWDYEPPISHDVLTAQLAQARDAAIEECASLAKTMSGHTHHDIAKRIRALKGGGTP
jgi:hypothetical protein